MGYFFCPFPENRKGLSDVPFFWYVKLPTFLSISKQQALSFSITNAQDDNSLQKIGLDKLKTFKTVNSTEKKLGGPGPRLNMWNLL